MQSTDHLVLHEVSLLDVFALTFNYAQMNFLPVMIIRFLCPFGSLQVTSVT